MKVYYAHCMALYDTPQEKRDVQTLKLDLGWDVLNPNCPEHHCGAVQAREEAPHDPHASMLYFKPLVESCNLLAFRALPDGAIPAGVFMEIKWARDAGIPVVISDPDSPQAKASRLSNCLPACGAAGSRGSRPASTSRKWGAGEVSGDSDEACCMDRR
jgi:hypothetical protein